MKAFHRNLLIGIIIGFIVLATGYVLKAIDTCAERGGRMSTDEWGNNVCYTPTSDADNPCTDSSECKNMCVTRNPNATQGWCYPETPFSGCWLVLENGIVSGTICS